MFYLRIIENFADLYNELFYVQTEKIIFLPNDLVFNISFWNLACFDALHDFRGSLCYLHGFFKLDLGLQTLNSIFSVFQKMEKEHYSIQPTNSTINFHRMFLFAA